MASTTNRAPTTGPPPTSASTSPASPRPPTAAPPAGRGPTDGRQTEVEPPAEVERGAAGEQGSAGERGAADRREKTAAGRTLRTDARRNRDRLLAIAREVFEEAGPEGSLIEIARRAGVGQGTLYRHFPTRGALLAAVLAERIETLRRQADYLSTTEPAGAALDRWLHLFLAHARTNHGLAGTVLVEKFDGSLADCHLTITNTAARLLTRAQEAGASRPDLDPGDLVQLVVGIALATPRGDADEQAGRLLTLALDAVHR